jgi:hypothetical protein
MLRRMHTPDDSTDPRRFGCIVSGILADHESAALVQGGFEPTDHVAVTVGIGQMNLGLAADPGSGRTAWVIQAAATLEGDALTVKQTAILDASGGAASRALSTAIPIGGTVRLIVRRDALHPELRAHADAPPRLNLAAFAHE